jgi:hypothetical protein
MIGQARRRVVEVQLEPFDIGARGVAGRSVRIAHEHLQPVGARPVQIAHEPP